MSGNNDEEYNDFANEDEEIKEEIGSDNDDQLQCTYDKFLMESVALNNNNGNSGYSAPSNDDRFGGESFNDDITPVDDGDMPF